MWYARGVLHIVATSAGGEEAEALLTALGADPPCVDSSAVEHSKPSPELFLTACEELSLDPARDRRRRQCVGRRGGPAHRSPNDRCALRRLLRRGTRRPGRGRSSRRYLIYAIIDGHAGDPEFAYRFITDELHAAGHACSENRVQRLCALHRVASSTLRKRRGGAKTPGRQSTTTTSTGSSTPRVVDGPDGRAAATWWIQP